jgi:hypothetical protein
MRMRTKLMLPAAVGASIAVGGAALGAGADSGSPKLDPVTSSRFVAADDRGVERHGPPGWDQDLADVMRRVHDAVAAKAPEIAGPIIDKAESDGKITSSQADKLREAAKSLGAGPPGGPRPDRLELEDKDVRAVVNDALRAVAQRAPAIAEPILDEAVKEKKITSAEADGIRRKLRMGPRIEMAGPGFRHHFGPGKAIDRDVATTLREIHQRVAKQAPDIAGPVIDKARSDGKITDAQADKLRQAAAELGGPPGPGPRLGGPRRDLRPGGPPRLNGPAGLDFGDADVREVLGDALAAIAKRVPTIAEPVIDRAVAQDMITSTQADRIRQMLRHRPELSDGPHPGDGPPGRPPLFGKQQHGVPGAGAGVAPAPLAGQRS